MAVETKSQNNPGKSAMKQNSSGEAEIQDIGMLCNEVGHLVSCYAKQKPTMMAMLCVGAGFILGWKLKPW